MKRNVIGLVLLASMFVASVRAEEAPAAPVAPAKVETAPATDAKTGMVASVIAQVMKPVNWTQANFWDKYPHIAGGTVTFVGLWAACRMYKPLGQALFGCKAEKSLRERAEYSF